MILEKDYIEVQSHGFQSTKTAEIKATPQMLRMLSSGIYSDKIAAFIRELSTNAYDAMVEAGTIKDKTFYVHLPTKLEPWFTIRDYGTGLSTRGMENNFSNFGDGTKAESNAYNGAFGLGSKSPLSYVRDFTIISYHDGKKTFYNYGKNDEDIPMLSTAFTQESDEHPGLEIQIAIQQNDIPEVLRKAELIYRYFDKRPESNIEIEYHDLQALIKGDGWFLTKPDSRANSYGGSYEVSTPARVVMGNVIYPVTSNGLPSGSSIYSLTNTPFVIKAELGDVQMTPSRESLEMTPKTIKFLEEKFKIILDDLGKNIEKNLDQSLSAFDKVISSFDLMKLLPGSITSCKIDKFTVSARHYEDIFEFPKGFFNTCKLKRVSTESSYSHRKTTDYHGTKWRPVNTLDYTFVLVDSKKRIGTIIDTLKLKHKQLYIIRPADGVANDSKDFKDMCNKFLDSCGTPKHLWASTEEAKLPPIVKTPRVKGAVPVPRVKGAIKARKISCRSNYISRDGDITIKGDEKGTWYYVETYRGDILDKNGRNNYSTRSILPNLVKDLEDKLGTTINLIELNSIYKNKVKDDDRFVYLFDEIQKHKFTVKVSKDKEVINKILNDYYFDSSLRRVIKGRKDCRLAELFTLQDDLKVDNNKNYKDEYVALGYVFEDAETIDLTEHKEALKKYKDLQSLSYNVTSDFVDEVMQMIDNRPQNLSSTNKIIKTKG